MAGKSVVDGQEEFGGSYLIAMMEFYRGDSGGSVSRKATTSRMGVVVASWQ